MAWLEFVAFHKLTNELKGLDHSEFKKSEKLVEWQAREFGVSYTGSTTGLGPVRRSSILRTPTRLGSQY
jgi:hypothetical protein